MKTIPFVKMSGAGNDFVIIDTIKSTNVHALAIKMCERTTGIGADGLLIFGKSKKADFQMRIINSDGSEAEMCGNGARCMAAYIAKFKSKKNKFTIETLAGIVHAEAKGELATITLSAPKDYQEEIPIDINGRILNSHFINTGVPHTVIFVDGLSEIDVNGIGRIIRYHEIFAPKGTNVNFVEQLKDDFIQIRTYERGVEHETKACGTGSVASAIITALKSRSSTTEKMRSKIKVLTASKEILEVSFAIEHDCVSDVHLKGSAKFIATGKYFLHSSTKGE